MPDSMKKNPPLIGVGSFSFHLQRSSPKSFLTERSTYLVRISAPAPCGRNRGPISPGRVRSATPYFSDCPDQCAALYLVRILTAARCAGFRQEKFSFSTTANYVKTYVKISPFHFIEKSPPDVARICEDRLNVFRLTAPSFGPWRRLKEGAKRTEFPI